MADVPSTILGRRDVALIPWITIALVAVAVAVSTALRPGGDLSDSVVIGAALAYAAVAAGLASVQRHPMMVRLAGSLPIYIVGSGLLVALLAAIGVLDRGVATVFFAPIVQVAFYLGLVLPTHWARGALVTLVATVCAVHAITPEASALGLATMIGLVAAAWMVGVLCHSAHSRAGHIALMLSRSDVLTGALNRRGFFDQFEAEIAAARSRRATVALLIVDLDAFKRVNDEQGHAAGDALLRWIGETFAELLPPRAALGRLGGDEFGVLLPRATRAEADAMADALIGAARERIGASVGVATSQDPDTTADDYLRVADAALYSCKAAQGGQRQSLVAGSTMAADRAPRAPKPQLTYRQLREAGGPPDRPAQGIHHGWLLRGGFWIVAAAGAGIVLGTAIEGPDNGWGRTIVWAGIPWVLANVALGAVPYLDANTLGRRIRAARIASSVLLGVGIGMAMLAGGGLTTPIVAGLYLKVLFDATVQSRTDALRTTAVTVVCWLIVVALSPQDQWWAAPYQAMLFVVSFALGTVGRRTFTTATSARLRLAHTDALTGLRNRPGFEQGAQRAFLAARAEGRPFGVVAFDLDDFKGVNDTLGHAAGDELLRRVAEVTLATLPEAYSVGRLGGDEFVAAVPVRTAGDAAELAAALAERLRAHVGASIGHAVHPADGDDLEALLRCADHRSYEVKAARGRPSGRSVGDEADAGQGEADEGETDGGFVVA